ncbi:TATA box-binding protein-associated factor RNA polymerase I subunit A isoform X4 [Kogia breviceps]
MSDFSEELIRPTTEDEQGEPHVPFGTGMCLPWLQKHIETIVTGGKQEKDFAQTTSACLSLIQEALLKHQWQRAAEYMHSYFQILEDSDSNKRQIAPEIIWRLGSEILYYHPKSNVETFNTFADRMKNIGVMNYLKISLQHALYLLHHGMLEDANRNLSQAETWRYGEKSSSQEVLINLIQAYKGLLQYYIWSKKKMELSQLDEDDYAYNTASQNMLNHSWKTSINLCALIQIPGVWDPFVKSYVEMLEFYGDQDGAREVLTNYAYDEKFPSNPNAHIYLYSFLKREKAPREKLISVLKVWIFLLSRMFLRFIHIIVWVICSLLLLSIIPFLYIHSPLDGHLGYFHSLAIMNTTVNIHGQVFVCTYIFTFLWYLPKSGIAGRYMFNLRNCPTVF